MAELKQSTEQQQNEEESSMVECVSAMESAVLTCLPYSQLQAIDPSAHQSDGRRNARLFMEAAERLQLYFTNLKISDKATEAESLRKEIFAMEEELKAKDKMIKNLERQVQGWRAELELTGQT